MKIHLMIKPVGAKATLCGQTGYVSADPYRTSCQACAASPDHPWNRR